MTRAIGIAVAVFALAVFITAEKANSAGEPSLEIIPAEVTTRTLPKDTPIEVEVRLKGGEAELAAISISTFSNDGITAEVAKETPAELKKLAPKAEYAWRLKLTRDNGSVLTDSVVHVRAAFDIAETARTARAGGAAPMHRLLYTTAKIKPQAVITGIELAKAEIKGAPERLLNFDRLSESGQSDRNASSRQN